LLLLLLLQVTAAAAAAAIAVDARGDASMLVSDVFGASETVCTETIHTTCCCCHCRSNPCC
jgi:hypothetical protein